MAPRRKAAPSEPTAEKPPTRSEQFWKDAIADEISGVDRALDAPQGGDSFAKEYAPVPPGRAPTANKVYKTVGGALALANKGAVDFLHLLPDEDKLTAEEIGALSIAFGDEILESKTLTRWFTQAAKNQVHVKLAWTLLIVVYPRLQRRGVVPPLSQADIDAMMQAAPDYDASTSGTSTGPHRPSIPVERGGSYGPDWDDQVGQIDTSIPSPLGTPIRDSTPLEGGFSEIPSNGDGHIIFQDGRPAGVPLTAAPQIHETQL